MPSEMEEKVAFLLSIPFFSHWFKKKARKLITDSTVVKTQRGQIMQHEGVANQDVFIVRRGEFVATKRL